MLTPVEGEGADMAGRVTLARVAAQAGVSQATVSKVLNARSGVSEGTRRRIEQLAEDLGYVAVAERQRPVRGPAEPLLEVLVDSLDNPYTWALLNGVVAAAESAGGGIVLGRVSGLAGQPPVAWAQRLARTGRIGVLEASTVSSRERESALRAVGLPLVVVDPMDEPLPSMHSIGATNWAGGLAAARHLVELGHERIAYVGGPAGSPCDVAREAGYLAVLRERAIPADPALVTHGPFTFDHGLAAGLGILGRWDRPTAVFAGCDLIAVGVLEAARRLGLRVPGDVSVVGFDDTGLAASSAPPLTTVHQPILEMGEAAVTTLFRLAASGTSPVHRVELATELVVRASTAPPAA
jgi:LacI family transcriptional regulator